MHANEYLLRQHKKEVTSLFKNYLKILEDMKADHDFHYNKLYELIPEKYHQVITAANHFTPDKLAWIRKRILDGGNESLRNFAEEMENLTVSFTFK
jgi:metal-responsive CopG/Arc/MetJ family transcriptional regulator